MLGYCVHNLTSREILDFTFLRVFLCVGDIYINSNIIEPCYILSFEYSCTYCVSLCTSIYSMLVSTLNC